MSKKKNLHRRLAHHLCQSAYPCAPDRPPGGSPDCCCVDPPPSLGARVVFLALEAQVQVLIMHDGLAEQGQLRGAHAARVSILRIQPSGGGGRGRCNSGRSTTC
jgi:hypothetical protein